MLGAADKRDANRLPVLRRLRRRVPWVRAGLAPFGMRRDRRAAEPAFFRADAAHVPRCGFLTARDFFPGQTWEPPYDLPIRNYSNRESTKSFASNGSKSPAFSPTPTKRTGNPSSRDMATTTPPLAGPSSLVGTVRVT